MTILEKARKMADRTGEIISSVTGFACVLLFAGMVLVTLLGIVFRYVVQAPLFWTEETARFLMLWTGFLAMSIAMQKGQHIMIDALVSAFPAYVSKPLGYLVDVMVGYFLVILLFKGYAMTSGTPMTALSLPISMAWIYAAVPLGALLTLVQLALNVVKKIALDFDPRALGKTQALGVGSGS